MPFPVITQPSLLTLPRVQSPQGSLTAIETAMTIPFDIRRVFYIYDVPGGEARGGHAHHSLQEVVIAVSGSLDVIVEDGLTTTTFTLNRSYVGLYVPPLTWRHLVNFSSGSVCLVLASELYTEHDYIRNYREFVRMTQGGRHVDSIS